MNYSINPVAEGGASGYSVPSSLERTDPTFLWRPFVVLVIGSFYLSVAGPLNIVVYVLLTLHAIRGSRQTVESLTIFTLLLLGNRALFTGGAVEFRWIFLFSVLGRVVWDTVFPSNNDASLPPRLTGATLAFLATALCLAVVAAKMPLLSVFKLLSFSLGVIVIFVSMHRTRHLYRYWESWLFTFFVFIVGISFLLYVTGQGRFRTGSLFQGVFAHPQMLGPAAGMIAAWFGGQALIRRRIGWHLGFAVAALALVYLSGARTGGVALVFGLLVAVAFWRVVGARPLPLFNFRRTQFVVIIIFVVIPVFVLQGPALVDGVRNYILKDDFSVEDEIVDPGATEVFAASRGGRMAESMENFYKNPVTGIGFGVPTPYEYYERMKTGAFGLPVSASYEKGFMPSAVLEEMGILGSIMTILMFISFAIPVLRFASFPMLWVFWAALGINFGAAVYFSIGGLGFLMWLMIGFAYNEAVGRLREAQVSERIVRNPMDVSHASVRR